MSDSISHPPHYGGDTVYECIKVIEAWGLDFSLGNTLKYISRAGKKGNRLEDLKKARWYLDHAIALAELSMACDGCGVVSEGIGDDNALCDGCKKMAAVG